ncbi:MAG: CotH kinase family protein, partial [Armatimonadaceae bacterium]
PKTTFQGFGGPPPAGFGSGSILAPIFVRAGDRDYDGELSRAEFGALGERWFGQWDVAKSGNLGLAPLQAGMNSTLKPPPMNLLGAEGKRNGVAGMMGLEFAFVRAALDVDGQSFPNVAVRYKGNGTYLGSMRSLKRPLKVDVNQHDPDASVAGVTTLNLHNSFSDASWMNDTLAHRFFRDAGVPSPRTGYANVRVNVPGLHDNRLLGLYEIVEDVDSRFIQERYGVEGGILFKPSTPELFGYRGDNWKRYNQMYDPKGKPTEAQAKRVIDLCKLVTLGSDAEFAKQIGDYVDIGAFANYMAALVCVTDLDGILGPGQNLYLFLHPKTGQFHFIPWDYDQSFGQFGMRGTQEQREQLSIAKPWQGENRFLERMFAQPQFQKAYRTKLRSLSTTLFTPERISGQVDRLATLLRPAVAAESKELLARFAASVAGKNLPPDGPWGSAIKPVKAFLPVRAQSIREQIAGK